MLDSKPATILNSLREYEYRPKWTVIVGCASALALAAVVFGLMAASNDRGLVIEHLIELEPDAATVFYWVLAVLCACVAVVFATLMSYHRLVFRQRLTLNVSALIGPVSR